MPNDYIPRPDARFHARQNNFGRYFNGHLADSGLAGGVACCINGLVIAKSAMIRNIRVVQGFAKPVL